MTTQQPEALRLADTLDLAPENGIEPQTSEDAAAELRRLHTENAALQAGYAAARLEIESLQARIKALAEEHADELMTQPAGVYPAAPEGVAFFVEYGGDVFTLDQMRAYADRTHALRMEQAAYKAVPGDALDEVMRERDDAEDFIDALLDEVLGHERPEWSSSYGRADALNDVQERITALHKPAVDKAWGRFQSAMAAPQQEAQEPVAWYVTGCGRLLDEDEAKAEARRIGGTARAMPLYTAPQAGSQPAPQQEAQQPGAAYAALPDADRDYMHKVVAVAVTMLFDGYKEDVTRVFSTGELSEFVTITAAMGGERVEDIYRRAWDLLSLPVRASHGQAPAQAADSVLEDAARLDWLALAGPTSICVVFDRPHDSEVEVATDDVTGYGKTLREAIDAARKQGAKHD